MLEYILYIILICDNNTKGRRMVSGVNILSFLYPRRGKSKI